jgi:hypothetical protein
MAPAMAADLGCPGRHSRRSPQPPEPSQPRTDRGSPALVRERRSAASPGQWRAAWVGHEACLRAPKRLGAHTSEGAADQRAGDQGWGGRILVLVGVWFILLGALADSFSRVCTV